MTNHLAKWLISQMQKNTLAKALQTCLTMEADSDIRLRVETSFDYQHNYSGSVIWNTQPPRHCANQHNMNYCHHYSGRLRNNNGS